MFRCARCLPLLWGCFVVLQLAGAVGWAQGTQAATKPITVEEAVYRNDAALIDILLRKPTDDQLTLYGTVARINHNYGRAVELHLTALRGMKDDPKIEYELACDFSLWNQPKLGMQYLQHAADHGFWGYRIIVDDHDVDLLKKDSAFPPVLEKIKTAFAAEAPKHAPGMTLKTPSGTAPSAGWPVVVFLHGFGSNRHDFDGEAEFVSTLGYVGITLDANDVMGPGAYQWGDSPEKTHQRVQAAIKDVGVPVNAKRIYLQGFSQGGMHVARLFTEHPDMYAGAICNSPGPVTLLPSKLANPAITGTLVLSIGDAESPNTKKDVDELEKMWQGAGRPVHVVHFNGGHQLPPDAKGMIRTALEQLSGGI